MNPEKTDSFSDTPDSPEVLRVKRQAGADVREMERLAREEAEVRQAVDRAVQEGWPDIVTKALATHSLKLYEKKAKITNRYCGA